MSSAVRTHVALAAEAIANAYAIPSFIAINPLGGFETTHFADATARASVLFRASTVPSTASDAQSLAPPSHIDVDALFDALGDTDTFAETCSLLGWGDLRAPIDERVSRWLAAFCDMGEAMWTMPYRGLGFFRAWKRLARHENAFSATARAYRRALDALPDRSVDALDANLAALGIVENRRTGYLARHLAQCAGWSAYIKHLAQSDDAAIDLTALLAVRTWYERQAVAAAAQRRNIPGTLASVRAWAVANADRLPLQRRRSFDCVAHMRAIDELVRQETAFCDDLLTRLERRHHHAHIAAAAQFVFCIDARSEPLRRAIEAVGFETIGFAGFFGFPVQARNFEAAEIVAQSPVLIRPSMLVDEQPATAEASTLRRRAARNAGRLAAIDGAVSHPITAFGGVEAFGLVRALRAAWRTFVARRTPEPSSDLPLSIAAIPFDQRVYFAEAALRMMGLTANFAPLVVLCGHAGATVNNAFSAALDCGACGGNPGLVNARVAALVLNDRTVQNALAARGIDIPSTTHFVAAAHDTTRDTVRFIETDCSAAATSAVASMSAALASAAAATRSTRNATLPPAPFGSGEAFARAADWAQVRPEWGLARNAGFIIASRERTRGADLDGRCFLHSYDSAADTDGAVLEQILTAPLVVAQWINMQYFFATVDPQNFGSGDKILQQAVGGFGVMQGNGGDLRLGLPLQSTTIGDRPYHEPLRLLAVVEAPIARIDAVIARQAILQRLFDHQWVHLVALDSDGRAQRYRGAHRWQHIISKELDHA